MQAKKQLRRRHLWQQQSADSFCQRAPPPSAPPSVPPLSTQPLSGPPPSAPSPSAPPPSTPPLSPPPPSALTFTTPLGAPSTTVPSAPPLGVPPLSAPQPSVTPPFVVQFVPLPSEPPEMQSLIVKSLIHATPDREEVALTYVVLVVCVQPCLGL